MVARHQDPRGPLPVATRVLPLVDRAAPDRLTGEHDIQKLEPPMLAYHKGNRTTEGG
jgi:hypothetical protein